MASAAVAKRRGSAHTARVAAKQRRQKIMVGVLGVVLLALLAYEVPHTLKLVHGSPSAAPAPNAPAVTGTARHRTASLLRGSGSGGDPFAVRSLANADPRATAAGGPDPFTSPAATRTTPSAPAVSTAPGALPQQIVIGRPGGNRVATHGWIVILASIPTGNSRRDAESFARAARRNVGSLSILNSSHRRPLRGGYWVVYSGPYATIGVVSNRAGEIHAAGYRTAYIRELITYR
jgi:hypothetical protein